MPCHFHVSKPKLWDGRYDRIPGDGSVFHLRYRLSMGRFWPMAEGQWGRERAEYWFEECKAVRQLADAIGQAKRQFNGAEGGCFVINEWGQVIIPSGAGDRRRYFVGVLEGSWSLVAPDDSSSIVSLDEDDGLACGDPWPWPYVGIPYHLSKSGRLYFVHRAPGRDIVEYAPRQYTGLIRAIREVRRWGAVKFIVNPFGLVLTKQPNRDDWNEEHWDPVYVGRLNYQYWFAKESA